MDLNLEPTPENPAQKRKIAMVLAFVSAAMILATLFTHGWLRAGRGADFGFGLMSMKRCVEGVCASVGNKEYVDAHNAKVAKYKELRAQYGMMGRDLGMDPDEPEEKSVVFWIAGYATLAFALLAVASLVAAGVTLGQGKLMLRPFAPTSTAMLFLFLALVTACIFVATNPTRGGDNEIGQFGVGWAFWVFGIGNVLGIVAVPMILKFKPVEPDHF